MRKPNATICRFTTLHQLLELSSFCVFNTTMTTPNDPEAYSNPVRLNVATRESSSNAIAGPSTSTPPSTKPLNERERLFEARKANEIVRRKGEKWADKLMEETVDRDTFKKAVRSTFHASSTHQRGEESKRRCGCRQKSND